MQKIQYFMLRSCPYCRQADSILNELMRENPAYRQLDIERIDEAKEAARANSYDYHYVPTFFVGEEKLLEGVPTVDLVRKVLDTALIS